MSLSTTKRKTRNSSRDDLVTDHLLTIGVDASMFLQCRNRNLKGAFWSRKPSHIMDVLETARQTYYRRIKLLHPDKNGDAAEAARVSRAYSRLCLLARRRGYEVRLGVGYL